MDTTTAQLYDILVEKGFDKTRVREALSEVVTTKELDVRLESLEGRIDHRFDAFELKIYRAMLIQTGAIVAILAALYGIFGA